MDGVKAGRTLQGVKVTSHDLEVKTIRPADEYLMSTVGVSFELSLPADSTVTIELTETKNRRMAWRTSERSIPTLKYTLGA